MSPKPLIPKLLGPKRKYSGNGQQEASFEQREEGSSRVLGALHFSTVGALLPLGVEAIESGRVTVIDLAGVKDSDSSGLALLIEWLSVAKAAARPLRYENVPTQLNQIARLSEVEELLSPS